MEISVKKNEEKLLWVAMGTKLGSICYPASPQHVGFCFLVVVGVMVRYGGCVGRVMVWYGGILLGIYSLLCRMWLWWCV